MSTPSSLIINVADLPATFVPHPEATSGHHDSYPYLYEPIHVAHRFTEYKCAGIATVQSYSNVQARNLPHAILILSQYVGDRFTKDW